MQDILTGKKIILGVTGCISAYKSCLITRELIKRGAEVKVVMTPSALEFITPLTLSTLSQNEVIVNTFPPSQKDGTKQSTWHIDLALWADLMLVAPASVNTIAKLANGFCDNALTTLAIALRKSLIVCPTADVDMYKNSITQENISKLKSHEVFILKPEAGFLASGLSGEGRLPTIGKIIDFVEMILSGIKPDYLGKKILVTAGPTYENIDPVRFIGNRSSGKMGFNIAKAAYLRGANVTLITGPTSIEAYPEIKTIKVRSAKEMFEHVESEVKKHDVLIMSAAVADFTPVSVSNKKIKKEENFNSIQLQRTQDILSAIKNRRIFKVGFALETENELANATKKLKDKKLDLIVLNSLNDEKSGFEYDSNKITIIKYGKPSLSYPLQTKFQAAHVILSEVNKLIK